MPTYDTFSASAAGTSNRVWTHTPVVNQPRGIEVWIIEAANSGVDQVSSVTYGGVPLERVTYVADTTGEPGSVSCWFKGSMTPKIPPGAQQVVVTVIGAANKRAVCITATADGNCYVDAWTAISGDQANPTIPLTTRFPTLIAAACHSGLNAVGSIAPQAGASDILKHDFGTTIGSWIGRVASVPAGEWNVGWTAAVEDVAAVALAIREPMRSDVLIGPGVYSAGALLLGPATLPAAASRISIVVDTTNHLDPAQIISADVEVSLDDGATWDRRAYFSRFGQPTPIKNGIPVTWAGWSGDLPAVGTPGRLARSHWSLEGPDLTTEGVLFELL